MADIAMIRTGLHQAPFKPFSVHLVTGKTYVVRHPDFASTNDRGRQLVIHEGGEIHLIDLRLVAEVVIPVEAQ